jgi:hypothetical protein
MFAEELRDSILETGSLSDDLLLIIFEYSVSAGDLILYLPETDPKYWENEDNWMYMPTPLCVYIWSDFSDGTIELRVNDYGWRIELRGHDRPLEALVEMCKANGYSWCLGECITSFKEKIRELTAISLAHLTRPKLKSNPK